MIDEPDVQPAVTPAESGQAEPDRPDPRRADDVVRLDFARTDRIGLPEALFCEGKDDAHVVTILDLIAANGGSMLLTRLAESTVAVLPDHHRDRLDYDPLSRTGWYGTVAAPANGTDDEAGTATEVAVVTGGTSDLRVSREVVRTLGYHGVAVTEITDVGVAGIWRLAERLDEIRRHRIVVAVAGMDAAMVSVLGGLVGGVVIAVPTSTGYGAARNGETALGSSLSSCAPGVLVCNIDNGYGAACAALRILTTFAGHPTATGSPYT
ncbi:MAG: nickel pincer cofactor biosynthesis protein LarB [Acidimicrobiales bacterium]